MPYNTTNVGRFTPELPYSDDDLFSKFEELSNMFTYEIGNASSEVNVELDDKEKKNEIIEVRKVNLKIKKNTAAHHTNKFEITGAVNGFKLTEKEFLIIRRGQPFNIKLKLSRPYDKTQDDIRLVFNFGKSPLPTSGTHVDLILSDEDKPKEWQAKILEKQYKGKSLKLQVTTPPTCPVGKWKLDFDVIKKSDTTKVIHKFIQKKHMYILFNPWCKDDQVHMPDDSLLKEYVLNENGVIFCGNEWSIRSLNWNFGQFKEDILDCCLYLLDKGRKSSNRGDPVMVSRKISALVNSNDGDRGVVYGNWSGDYEGGKSPLAWTGSEAILNEYYKTKRGVKYGQCWVFSGIVTTVCRALGIPTRSVSNFSSAHDTDRNVTIEKFINENGEPWEDYNHDSIWNFHVWNDVWMSRPDLQEVFKQYQKPGWQAIDATPQETSEGTFCMGPMPLEAIKHGDLTVPFDGPFVFAEVNADEEVWLMKDNELTHIVTHTNAIGKRMSTKQPHTKNREDVTDQYKFREGTKEERSVVSKVERNTETEERPLADRDIAIAVSYDRETRVGDDLRLFVKISNRGTERRTVTGKLTFSSEVYTGVRHKAIANKSLDDAVIYPGTDKLVELTYTADEYLDKFTKVDFFNFRIFGFINEPATKQFAIDDIHGRFVKPDLAVKAITKTTPTVGTKYEIEVSFVNPLKKQLTHCELVVDGSIQKVKDRKLNDVMGKSTVLETIEMFPTRAGETEIIVKFNSIELTGIEGSIEITVSE